MVKLSNCTNSAVTAGMNQIYMLFDMKIHSNVGKKYEFWVIIQTTI